MTWSIIDSPTHVDQIIKESHLNLVLIFKHSTRCGISAVVLDKLERKWDDGEMEGIKTYFLDLIRNRELSDQIAHVFHVEHQSPQVLLIHKGRCIHHASHFEISYQKLRQPAF